MILKSIAVFALAAGFGAAQEVPLTKPITSPDFDFTVTGPNWTDVLPPPQGSIAQVNCPDGGAAALTIAKGRFWVEYNETGQPRLLDHLVQEFLKTAPVVYPAYKELALKKNFEAGGCPAFSATFSAKHKDGSELAIIRTIVQRQPNQYFLLCASGAIGEKDRLQSMMDRVAATFKPTLPVVKETESALAESSKLLASEKVKPGLIGETWHYISTGGTRVGYQWTVVAAADVDGLPGYSVRTETLVRGTEKDSKKVTSTGRFTVDGGFQEVETTGVLEDENGRVEYSEKASIKGGKFEATRKYGGVEDSVAPKRVASGTMLVDVAEVLRRHVVLAKPGLYALAIFAPFADFARYETLEFTGAEKKGTHEGEQDVILVLAGTNRSKVQKQLLFDAKGGLIESSTKGSVNLIRRCSKEEATKKP